MPIHDVVADQPWPPRPVRVVPLDLDLGEVGGHRFWLRSIEDWHGWMDVRIARVDEQGGQPLPRRLPPPAAWRAWLDGLPITVADAVGRGDRRFSDGEVRLRPGLPDDAAAHDLRLEAEVLAGETVAVVVSVPPATT